jgi:catechol 2,3-dioxygenase-like lactoylglutathione lyase family enzyme
MTALHLGGLHHVAVAVTNLGRSVAFYERLGFEVVLQWRSDDSLLSISHLTLGGTKLELLEDHRDGSDPPALCLRPSVGIRHLALSAPNLDETLAAFRLLGADIMSPGIRSGKIGDRSFFAYDPDGIALEVVETPQRDWH